jgi:hypothetical protein
MKLKKPPNMHEYSLRMCYNFLFPTGMHRYVSHSREAKILIAEWVFWYESQGWQFEGPNADQAT